MEDTSSTEHKLDSSSAEHHATHHEHRPSEHAHDKGKSALETIMGYKKHVLVTIFYLAVALVMFYPVTLHIASSAPGTGGDTFQNLWDIWWVKYAVFNLHTSAFSTNLIYWPLGTNLAYVTLAPLNGILYAPFQAISVPFAYNIMYFLGFALSGLTMFILAYYLTHNDYASLIAGFIFTFSAFHIAQSLHIHFVNIEWVPLFLYFFLKVLDEGITKYFNIIGMSASFALSTLMGNIEQTIMLFLMLILMIVVYLFYKETRRKILTLGFVLSIIIFAVLSLAIGAWNFIPLLNAVKNSGGLSTANYLNNITTNAAWSIKPIGLFVPSYYNGFFYKIGISSGLFSVAYPTAPIEQIGYIGYVVLILALYGIYKNKKGMLPWAIGAIIFIWLALGPAFGLYQIYHAVPGLSVVREPGRFDMIASMFLAILAAFGAKALFEQLQNSKMSKTMVYSALVVILVIMFIESNGTPFGSSPKFVSNATVPTAYGGIANVPGNFSVLGLPALPLANSTPYLYPAEDTYYTSVTHKPIVGGYTGRENLSTTLLLYNVPLILQTSTLITNGTPYYLSPINENYTNQTLFALYQYQTEFIVVHRKAFSQQQFLQLANYLDAVFGSPVSNDNTTTVFVTLSAINRTIFRSYVAYPVITQWQATSILVNGSYQTYWVPIGAGSVILYAPYQSGINTTINPNVPLYVNTTISFTAFSYTPQTLYIAEPGAHNTTKVIENISLTTSPTKYRIKVPFLSGPQGNSVLFLYRNTNVPVLVSNITFSRST